LREGPSDPVTLQRICQGESHAPKYPPARVDPVVEEQILAIRDQPPEDLRRTPGPKAIQYFLARDPLLQLFQLPVPGTRTIYRIRKSHQRISERSKQEHHPIERPAPLSHWQIDFKVVSSVPADPRSATCNVVDVGTSILLDAHVRADFTRDPALACVLQSEHSHGRPYSITVERDPWLSSATYTEVIFPRPWSVCVPVWALMLRSVIHSTPNTMGSSKGIIEPLNKNASSRIGLARQNAELPLLHQEREEELVARWLLTQEKIDESTDMLLRLLNKAREAGRVHSVFEIQVLLAQAHAARKQRHEAREILCATLAQAHAEGYIRLFLDEGDALIALLQTLTLREPPLRAYLQTILHAATSAHIEQSLSASPAPSVLVTPLSSQEQKVLRLLAAGSSNPEIAQSLVVSVTTVRTQVQSIYRKLGVNNRVAASEMARHLRLL
jgi:DNA-binding NarL/FixJ family response regulator